MQDIGNPSSRLVSGKAIGWCVVNMLIACFRNESRGFHRVGDRMDARGYERLATVCKKARGSQLTIWI